MTRFHVCCYSFALTAVTLSCGNRTRSPNPTVSDSAGITLVHNEGPVGTRWDVDVDLVIGEEDGADEYTFGRIEDVAVDSRGRFLVLDQLAQELKIYDASGTYVARAGGAGQGPGELTGAMSVSASPRDSIYVSDLLQGRINVYGTDGTDARQIGVPPYLIFQAKPLSDEFVLGRAISLRFDSTGLFRTWDGLLRIQQSSGSFDTLLTFEYAEPNWGKRPPGELRQPIIVNTAFWDRLTDGRLAWSALDNNRVYVHAPDGRLVRIVSHSAWNVRPSTADDRSILEALYRRQSNRPADPLPPTVDIPEQLPAITQIRASPDGGLWVLRMGAVDSIHEYAVNNSGGSGWLGGTHWDVLDDVGQAVATAQLPIGFRATRILTDVVVGIQKDALGVDRVVRLRIRRP